MTDNRKNITQPADWWAAFEAKAQSEGKSLSQWIGDTCRKALGKDGKNLSTRRPANRPKNNFEKTVHTDIDDR